VLGVPTGLLAAACRELEHDGEVVGGVVGQVLEGLEGAASQLVGCSVAAGRMAGRRLPRTPVAAAYNPHPHQEARPAGNWPPVVVTMAAAFWLPALVTVKGMATCR
jgi:hypothetical protein